MSTGEMLWLLFLGGVCILALVDWKRAIYLGLLVDVLRDPIRKLTEEQPIRITVAGAVVWLLILVSATFSQRAELRTFLRNYPKLKSALTFLVLAIGPPFILSCLLYQRGWLMASIGAASYLIPSIGVFTGFAFLRKPGDAFNLMKWYVLLNSIMLLSVPMEYLDWDVPALGGIQFEWIRYREGYIVDLMSGWYRSPDVMGLHAAHVIMFSLILTIRSSSVTRIAWLAPVLWAGFCVLLSGRRKMVGVPLVFVAVFLALGMYFRVARVSRFAGFALFAALMGGAGVAFFWAPEESFEYTDFASSIFTEGVERSNEVIVGSTISTLQQVGVLGKGLGTATQGRHYAGIDQTKFQGWQEDGVSRLFMEFGVPGVLLLIAAIVWSLQGVLQALSRVSPKSNDVLLQLGLTAVVAGDAASFAISHQQFSGDPINALVVTLLFGMILRVPLMGTTQRASPNANQQMMVQRPSLVPRSFGS